MANPTLFWANPGTEPKRAYRWIMRFNINNENALDEFLIKKVSRPSWDVSETEHAFLNHTFYYPGRVTYKEVNVTLVDSITPNAGVNMQNLLVKSGYVVPDAVAQGDFRTISKSGWVSEGGAGLGRVEIVQIDPDNRELETWSLYNTWIKSCDLGELDYESNELLNVELVLRYDYFKIGEGPRLARADIEPLFRS